MLLPCLASVVISFVDFPTALRLRAVNTVFLEGWILFVSKFSEDYYPSRTMVQTRRCMVCSRTGDMGITRVPWSILPPRLVFVHCPWSRGSYCKYRALRSLVRRPTNNGSRYRIVCNTVFGPTMVIPRSHGGTTVASPSPHYVVEKKDGRRFVHATWIEKGNLFEKCIRLSDPALRGQLLAAPNLVTSLWGN